MGAGGLSSRLSLPASRPWPITKNSRPGWRRGKDGQALPPYRLGHDRPALSLPPAACGSRRLTPLRGAGVGDPVATPARVGPVHSPRRSWTSDCEPGPSRVQRVVPGRAPGWARVSAPTHRPPAGAGPEKEGRPNTHRRRSFWNPGASFPSESRCRSQPSAWLAACLLHTRTRAHTRAQTHRLPCTRAPSIALAPGGRVRGGGGTAGPGPWGAGVHRPPRKAPGRDESEAGGAAATESSSGPPPIP